MAKNLKITQVKSVIGSPQTQRDTMSSLGLKKIRQSVVHPDNPAVRGQVHKVRHLVTVEEID
ncbi:50S ribosomal protein L30 [Mobiluncus mulieris]|uniref:Large ribosomal subunit protein uL30 n=2 Tax=Mobiluncus mulieris TaxID=2052 RepID=E0QTM0_9ACTO|nr:50S ribosomal protein L30 [Mobiluncus mulieris]EEJ53332.1 ribosomal protein L30 [Mobiluncus mulieris ATCC 35243]EEZ91306.1 ribosomal protein L30 [Mobiluncus mulieris 28-1]EFM45064.1 ribosomal protein L30 [Mobiluncus mulieris ATCC 35239]EFN92862.1 ribosomal protein L30 [Mobiluncus mulieris FB024-16]MBB5845363.1 large subunit ribosomal protein L30 [Mobiluncus mulieris]